MFDIVDGISARMRAHGHAPGSAVEMVSHIEVEDSTPGRVRLHWKAASRITGALTGVGSRIMEGVVRRMTSQFWQNFADRVAREPA
jgi:carbon monoxide dehydrogenase subunit G